MIYSSQNLAKLAIQKTHLEAHRTKTDDFTVKKGLLMYIETKIMLTWFFKKHI